MVHDALVMFKDVFIQKVKNVVSWKNMTHSMNPSKLTQPVFDAFFSLGPRAALRPRT